MRVPSWDAVQPGLATSPARMVLCGGMDKHFFDWHEGQQNDFLARLLDQTRQLGPFILMDSAGIPDNVGRQDFDRFMRLYRSLR